MVTSQYALGQYNVVIMMDPNPAEFDRQWIDLLKDFCEYKAGGVLFMAGPQFTSEFFYRFQLTQFLAVTPDIQVIADPALNPGVDVLALFGVRLRAAF